MSKSHAELIALWPSLSEFAAAIAVNYDQAKLMKRRNSIAVEHWPKLVEDAARRGFADINYTSLVDAVVARRGALRRSRVPVSAPAHAGSNVVASSA